MPDREKVMNNEDWCKKNCPYNTECSCDGVCNFVLSLLKEQQNQIWELQDQVEYLTDKQKEQYAVEPFHKCIGNEFSLIEDSHFDYCPYCGKPITWVTWAKQEGR